MASQNKFLKVHYWPVRYYHHTNQVKFFLYQVKAGDLSPIPVFRMSSDFFGLRGAKYHELVSKFNYRVKTIYIP
jgi:hypothetical protein